MKSFDEIYELYVNDVFKYLMCLTGDSELSEELTQETFFKAYKNIDGFQGKCKLSVWLCQIAKNSYFSYNKKIKLKNREIVEERTISEINVQEDFIQSSNVILLHKILHTLEEPYKEVFTLKLFGELSYQQIGEIFSKSESWGRVTYYRAKEKIKAIFNEREGFK
jgi:RNA polymerase sigma-70 factor (ECF subfamily)